MVTKQEAAWPMTVAMAAPRTPMWNTKMATGSRIRFSTAPMTVENME